MRFLILLILGAITLSSTARAGLEIKKARYGNTAKYRDVRGIIEAYVRNNTLSFVVNARSMGGDPTGRLPDYFFVVYEVNGREFTDTIAEGKVFTFQGIPGLRPVQPPLGIAFLKPAAPVSAPLAIVNRSTGAVIAYTVDRFGRWVWAADLVAGRTLSLTSKVGEQWVLVDSRGNVVAQDRISRGDNVLIAEPVDRGGGFRTGGEEAWVRFENRGFRPLYVYNLDPVGRWNWMATLEPGGGYSANARVGDTWVVADTSNRVVRNVTVAPGQSRVMLD